MVSAVLHAAHECSGNPKPSTAQRVRSGEGGPSAGKAQNKPGLEEGWAVQGLEGHPRQVEGGGLEQWQGWA